MTVDMSICKPGDILISRHGTELTYVRKATEEEYGDHIIQYPKPCGRGTRFNNGYVYQYNRMPEVDHDVVYIMKEKS